MLPALDREAQRIDLNTTRQLTAALGLQEVTSREDAALLQNQLAQLHAQGIIDANALAKLQEPFQRLGLISSAITLALVLSLTIFLFHAGCRKASFAATNGSDSSRLIEYRV